MHILAQLLPAILARICSRTPIGALRASSVSRSLLKARQRHDRAAAFRQGASSATCAKGVLREAVNSLISGMPHLFPIGDVLERLHADAAIGVQEAFARLALLQDRH